MKVSLLFTLFMLAAATLILSCSKPPSGKEVFNSEFCPACHYFRGMGKPEGIDLSRVGERRNPGWIREHIINPKSHDPNIGMPSHAHLPSPEIDALVRMLTSPMPSASASERETRQPL